MNNLSAVKYRQIEERAAEVARYIVDNNATVRQAAKAFGIRVITSVLDEEKKKLEEERRLSLEMMAELQKLKEQLAAQQSAAAEPTESKPAEAETKPEE